MSDKVKAQEIFTEIIAYKGPYKYFHVDSMIHLVELLIIELKAFGHYEVFKEIMSLMEKLSEIATSQKYVEVLIHTQIMEAKLKIIELDFDTASDLLDSALGTAKQTGLQKLTVTIEEEIREIRTNFKGLEKFFDANSNYGERLEKMEIQDYLQKVRNIVE
ncbi:MAG: hypothetical protein IH840_04180 [Candidatus Heimdallarchaeota archaeon]|nr:hypothetical protein [Candidatus Heimdallarchaeota archaeon]